MISGRLREILLEHNPVAVLVSGGCDSEVLLRAAAQTLGTGSVLALTARTPLLTRLALERAERLAQSLSVNHVVFSLDLLDDPFVGHNTPERCYHCKKRIYTRAREEAASGGILHLADGTNQDDTKEHRPGLRAAREEGILQPFALAGMTKRQVRDLGARLGMPDPERPADSCLATRFRENTSLTLEQLSLVESLESLVKPLLKGRLRARQQDRTVLLEFMACDQATVENHLPELTLIAERHGLTLQPHLIPVA